MLSTLGSKAKSKLNAQWFYFGDQSNAAKKRRLITSSRESQIEPLPRVACLFSGKPIGMGIAFNTLELRWHFLLISFGFLHTKRLFDK